MSKLDYKILFGISVILLSIGIVSIGDTFAQTNEIPELLSDVPVSTNDSPTFEPSNDLIRESKQVYADTSVFDQDTFTITVFDETLTITKDYIKVYDDYTVWMGSTQDGFNANFVIDNDTIDASVSTPQKSYTIGWTGTDTIHTLNDLDLSQLPPDHGADYDSTADETSDYYHLPRNIQKDIELYSNSYVGGRDYRENALTITLVVGYTASTETNLGPVDNRTIRKAVADANRAYADNRLPIILNLVETEELRYVESTGTSQLSALSQDLDNLLDADVNTLDRLRAIGVNQDADVVILITHYSDPTPTGIVSSGCGKAGAILADNADNSVAVVRDICLKDNLSLPHEIGHLQGARHNPERDSNNNPFTYQHGYFDASVHQRTIMSYNEAACYTSGHLKDGCVRKGLWSDPNETFFGATIAPAGTENSHFNAKVLYGSIQHISSLRGEEQRFYNPSPPDMPTNLQVTPGNGEASLSWIAPSDNGGSTIIDYIIQYKLSSVTSWTTFADSNTSVSPSTIVTGLTNGQTYDFRVAAVNNSVGTGDFSTSVTSTLTLQVPPVLSLITHISVSEGTTKLITANATDSNGDSITYSLTSSPSWVSINPNNGVITINTPSEVSSPRYVVTVRATDNDGYDSKSFTLSINEVNQAPILSSIGDKSVAEESTLSFTVTATDSDLPANILSYSMTDAPTGATINSSTGEFSWTPTNSQAGTYNVTFTVTDNGSPAYSDSETITISVSDKPAPTPQTPPVLNPINDYTFNEGRGVSFVISATDSNGDSITYSLTSSPSWVSINPNTGRILVLVPSELPNSSYLVTIKATDNDGYDTESFNIIINELNQAPILSSIGDKSVAEESTLSFTISASDSDLPANILSYSMTDAPTGATINSNTGEFSWTPTNSQAGTYNVTFTVTDNGSPAYSDSETITISVSDKPAPTPQTPPVLNPINDITANKGQAVLFNAIATDSNGDTIQYSLTSSPSWVQINPNTGKVIILVPYELPNSSYLVTVKATDNDGYDTESFNIIINELNPVSTLQTPPVLNPINDITANKGQAVLFNAIATDSNGDTIQYSLTSSPSWVQINPNTGKVIILVPYELPNSSYLVTVKATDNDGYDTESFNIIINELNQAPILSSIGDKSVAEESTLSFTVTATDSDLPANILSYSMTDAPTGATINSNTGEFSWTPTNSQAGTYNVTFKVIDNGTPTKSDTETVTITVTDNPIITTSNTAPVLDTIPNYTGILGDTVSFTLTASDPDVDQTLSFSISLATHHMVNYTLDSSTGLFTWTPTEDQIGNHSILFKVTDNGSPVKYDLQRVSFTISR